LDRLTGASSPLLSCAGPSPFEHGFPVSFPLSKRTSVRPSGIVLSPLRISSESLPAPPYLARESLGSLRSPSIRRSRMVFFPTLSVLRRRHLSIFLRSFFSNSGFFFFRDQDSSDALFFTEVRASPLFPLSYQL